MKRKTSTTPTKIYTYGCLPPVEGADKLDEQLWRAHRYRCGLVEIERRRRERIAQVQREHDVLGGILETLHSAETTVAEARRETKLLRAGAGDAEAVAAQRELVEAALADVAVLRFFLARARMLAKLDEALKADYKAVEEQSRAEIKLLRASDEAPYWGTYLSIEKAAEAWRLSFDPPRFLRYAGEGRAVVQIQKGMTTAEIESGQDTRLRFGPATPRISKKTGRVQTAIRPEFRTVRIRVCSDGRAPVWAALPFVLDRPLPADGKIMWAWIIRRRVGVRFKYELQLTIEAESFGNAAAARRAADHRPHRFVAVDVGTRDLPTGEVRAALWLDSTGVSGELKSSLTRLSSPTARGTRAAIVDGQVVRVRRRCVVPADMGKVEDLRRIRDKNLDEIKETIAIYRKQATASDFLKRTERAALWRSPARVGLLLRHWQRHEGDDEIRNRIAAYLKQDRHLLDWESHERSRSLNRRREGYRVFAARIATEYDVIVLAKRDYRRSEWAPEHAKTTRGTDSRAFMFGAAPGELCEEIKRAAKSRGARVVEVRLDGDTAWALDARVCAQLLASAEMIEGQAQPLAAGKPRNHVNSIELRSRRRLGTVEKLDPLAKQRIVS